jgi:signal transduction histidine kinase
MNTEKTTRVLILEHAEEDIELLCYELRKGGFNYESEIVETRETFMKALADFRPEIVLSDYSLPTFDGLSAYQIKQQLRPDIPFIIVSGTIGEENAVELIKQGVTDYVLKDKLFTIIPKIKRALKETRERIEKALAEANLRDREKQFAREREEHQRILVRATIESQEKERGQIGRELHDNINQILAVTKAYVDTALHDGDERRDQLLERSLKNLDTAINEIRKMSKSLVPPSMKEDGLVESVVELVENMRVVNRFSIDFRCEKEDLHNLGEGQQLALYRIVQEQVNNIIKHSQASNVFIELNGKNDYVHLMIRDNGKGFNPKLRSKGVGLSNIISRIEVFNGNFELISSEGSGCTLKIEMPRENYPNS